MTIPRTILPLALAAIAFSGALVSMAQTSNARLAAPAPLAASAPTAVPALVPFSGLALTQDGKPLQPEVEVNFLIFKEEQGGEALWMETQSVAVDLDGHYKVQLGAASSDGLPMGLFSTGEARWLEVQVAGERPQARVLLASVPYALKAGDATTLGGLPVSAFALAGQNGVPAGGTGSGGAGASPGVTPTPTAVTTTGGTAGYLSEFSGASTIVDSPLFVASSGDVGINETSPTANLDVNGTENVRGVLSLPALATATATAGQRSQLMEFGASAWDSATSAAVSPIFKLLTNFDGNDTASPSGDFELHYQLGGVSTSILSIANTGVIAFAPTQTFPGTIKSVVAAAPLTVQNTSGAISLGLNTTALETTLNSFYARLNAANTFVGNQSITGNAGVSGTLSAGATTLGNTNTGSLSATGNLSGESVLSVGPASTATTTAGVDTFLEQKVSVYNSSSAKASTEWLGWHAMPLGNDTASTGMKLDFVSNSGGTFSFDTGLSLAQNGQITFASGQTFPGTITSVAATAPITVSNSGGVSTLGLNTFELENTLSADFPTLAGDNTFSGSTVFQGSANFRGGASFPSGGVLATASGTTPGYAIYGTGSSGATGIEGVSDSGEGVSGQTATGIAIFGNATGNGTAGYFSNDAVGNSALYATNSASGALFSEVNAFTAATTGNFGTAVFGNATGEVSTAVLGDATGADGFGVVGSSSFTNSSSPDTIEGFGVRGSAVQGIGILGSAGSGTSSTYNNLYANGPGEGVWGDVAGSTNGSGIIGTADDSIGGLFENTSEKETIFAGNAGTGSAAFLENKSNSAPTIQLFNNGSGGTGASVIRASGRDGSCDIGTSGDLSCTGQLKSLVSASGGARKVETYAMQSPENWMEDFGSGVLERGVAVVTIDPAFAETVTGDAGYHVFITPNGDSKGLYVISKTATSFEVRESGGGVSSLSFDYRIVAKRRGYEAQRLRDVTESFNATVKATIDHSLPASNPASSNAPRPVLIPPTPPTPRMRDTTTPEALKSLAK